MHSLVSEDKVSDQHAKKLKKSIVENMKNNCEKVADQIHCRRAHTRSRAFTYPPLSFEMDFDLSVNSIIDINERTPKKLNNSKLGVKPICHSRSLQTLKCNGKDLERMSFNTMSKENTTVSSDLVLIRETSKVIPVATVTPQESPKEMCNGSDSSAFINAQNNHRNAVVGARDDIPMVNRAQNNHVFQSTDETEYYRRYRSGICQHYLNDENRTQARARDLEQGQYRDDYVMSLSDDDTYYSRSRSYRPDHVINVPNKASSLSFPPAFSSQNRNHPREPYFNRANNYDENRFMSETDPNGCIRSPVHPRSRPRYEENLSVHDLLPHRNYSSCDDSRRSGPLPLMPYLRSSQDHDTDFDIGTGMRSDLNFPTSTSPPSVATIGHSSNTPRMHREGRLHMFQIPMSQWRLNSSQSLLSRSLSEFSHDTNDIYDQEKRNRDNEREYTSSYSTTDLNTCDVSTISSTRERMNSTSEFCWNKYPLVSYYIYFSINTRCSI